MGAQVRKFEIVMASHVKIRHFVMINSRSSANLIIKSYFGKLFD